MHSGGPSGTWEALPFPSNIVVGDAMTQRTLAWMEGCRSVQERTIEHAMVLPNEGNEARQEEWQGVGAARSSREGGEPIRGTHWSEGAAGNTEPLKG